MIKILLAFSLLLPISAFAEELLIFGGPGHDEFLGCVRCNEFSSKSVCNGFGKFGNQFSTGTLWNEFSSPYGNKFSSASPWNEFSTSKSVPVLVDQKGSLYGYFTINDLRSDAVSFASHLKRWFAEHEGDLEKVRKRLCNAFGYSG